MKKEIPGERLLYIGQPYGFEEHLRRDGTGDNNLRTGRFAQPRTLRVGDILATGDKVLSPPREGGNGSILLHLTGGFDGHWFGVPARMPIAILTPEDHAPAEIKRLGTTANIVMLFIASEKGAPMREVAEVKVSTAFGLGGDRYGMGKGSWSTPGRTHRQVSFIEYEAIQEALLFPPSDTRRNIVTHGVRLNKLVGKEFSIRSPSWENSARFRA